MTSAQLDVIKESLGTAWTTKLEEEFNKPYFSKLVSFLEEEYKTYRIWPKSSDVFAAYRAVVPSLIKVLIIGQDPYPNAHAHGYSFSSKDTKRPVSLQYIFKEIATDVGLGEFDFKTAFPNNDLTPWTKQGVFLLNSVLTVRENQSNSHKNKGWEEFTQATVRKLIEIRSTPPMQTTRLVIMLWGRDAQNMFKLATNNLTIPNNILVLTAGHPAAAAYGKDVFSGNKHFSQAAAFLRESYIMPIRWTLGQKSQ